jgi:hypothetical protein
MNSERELDAATVALDRFGHSKQNTYAVLAGMTGAGAFVVFVVCKNWGISWRPSLILSRSYIYST